MPWRNVVMLLPTLARLALQQFYNQPKIWISLITCLGIAIAGFMFSASLVYQVLYAPLPFNESAQRYALKAQQGPFTLAGTNALYLSELRELYLAQSKTELSSMASNSVYWAPTPDQSIEIQHRRVSDNFFQQWSFPVLLGTLDTLDEQAVVIDLDFWRYHLQQDPNIIGQLIRLNGQWFSIHAVIDSTAAPSTPASRKLQSSIMAQGTLWQLQQLWLPESSEQRQLLSPELFIKSQTSQSELTHYFRSKADQINTRSSALDTIQLEVINLRQALWGSWYWLAPLMLIAATLLCLIGISAMANLMLAHGTKELRNNSLYRTLGADVWQVQWIQFVQITLASSCTVALAGFLAKHLLTKLLQLTPELQGLQSTLTIQVIVICWLILVLLLWLLLNLPGLTGRNQPLALSLASSGKGACGQFNLALMKKLTFVQVFAITTLLLLGMSYLEQNVQRLLPLLSIEHTQLAYLQIREFQPADLSQGEQAQLIDTIHQQLLNQPAIEQIALLNADPLTLSYHLFTCQSGGTTTMQAKSAITENAFAMLNFPVIAGQIPPHLLPGEVVINKEAAMQLFGRDNPIGKKLPCLGAAGEQLVVAVVQTSQIIEEDFSQFFSYAQGVIFNHFSWYTNELARSDKATFLIKYQHDVPHHAVQQIVASHKHQLQFEPLQSLSALIQQQRNELISGALVALFLSVATVAIAAYSLYSCLSYQASLRQHQLALSQCLGMPPRALLLLLWRDNAESVLTAMLGSLVLTALADWLFAGQAVSLLAAFLCSILVLLIFSISAIHPGWQTLRNPNLRAFLY